MRVQAFLETHLVVGDGRHGLRALLGAVPHGGVAAAHLEVVRTLQAPGREWPQVPPNQEESGRRAKQHT